MITANRHALIVGISDFDDANLLPLPGCALDLAAMRDFANDPQRGNFGNVSTLASPTKQELLLAASDLFERAAGPDQFAMLFIATHGVTENMRGLVLCCRDTRCDRISASTLAIDELYSALNEFSCHRTIAIIDACESGGISGGISSLARDKLWRSLTQSTQEGHHVIASCGTREPAQESSTGGVFTQHLLDVIERVGLSRATDEWLSVEVVAGEVVRSASGLGQTPEWSGLSISTDMPLCRNPHWDSASVHTTSLLSSSTLGREIRAQINTCIHSNSVSLTRIGQAYPWTRDALRAAREMSTAVVEFEIRYQYFLQTARAGLLRVAQHGTPAQQLEAVRYVQELIVLIAAAARDARADMADSALVELLTRSLAPVLSKAIESWRDSTGWFRQEDGPSAVALTSIRFWDALAAVAFAAIAALWRGERVVASKIIQCCKETIENHRHLVRLVWAGQYPDMVCVLSAIASEDVPFAEGCAVEVFQQLAKRRLPLPPVQIPLAELGRELALQLFDQTSLEDEYADEGFTVLLALLHASNTSELKLNTLAASIPSSDWRGRLSLYIPTHPNQCAMPQMLVKIPAEYSLQAEGIAALLNSVSSFASIFDSDDEGLGVLLSLSGAAVYRNRTGIEAAMRTINLWRSKTG